MSGTFAIKKERARYCFELRDENGEVVFKGSINSTKEAVERQLELMKGFGNDLPNHFQAVEGRIGNTWVIRGEEHSAREGEQGRCGDVIPLGFGTVTGTKEEVLATKDAIVAAEQGAQVDEFFREIRAQLQSEGASRWEALKRERCAAALAVRLEGDPSKEEVDRSVEDVRRTFEQTLAREGKLKAEKAADMGVSEEQMDALLANQGEFVARQGAAVRLMADHLDVKASDADLERVVADGMRNDPDARKLLDTEGGRARLAEAARCEKALDWVVEHAQVVDEPEGAVDQPPAGPVRPNPFE